MPDTYKNLGQAIPGAGVLTALYTVPLARSAVISTVVVCNQAAAATTFRLAHAIAGAADTAAQYLHYDVALAANDTFALTLGITVAAQDVLRGRSANGSVSFNVYGAEIT